MRVLFFVLLLFTFTYPALAAEDIYICPMHPHIEGVEGDMCPICGMSLVPKIEEMSMQNSHDTHSETPENAFKIDPSYVHVLGVKTAEVTHHTFGHHIRGFGQIVPSTRLEHAVDVRTKGWIVDLPVDAVGDTVKKGDLLFTYYSPDLMMAQSDYLLGRRIGNAEHRLKLFGMDKKAINTLKKKRKFLDQTPFHAPVGGTITMLNARTGSHINEGANVMRIQDFSKLWVNVDVPLRDIQFLEIGAPAKVTLPETGEIYKTTIDFIHPVNDPQSRTVTVRLILDNADGILKSNTYVDVDFNGSAQSRLAVPSEAILYSTMGAYVMEHIHDGYFRPVMVQTGITANRRTEITQGLKHGQRIVTSGQFMLDAEANLKGGMAAMEHNHTDMNGGQQSPSQGGIHVH